VRWFGRSMGTLEMLELSDLACLNPCYIPAMLISYSVGVSEKDLLLSFDLLSKSRPTTGFKFGPRSSLVRHARYFHIPSLPPATSVQSTESPLLLPHLVFPCLYLQSLQPMDQCRPPIPTLRSLQRSNPYQLNHKMLLPNPSRNPRSNTPSGSAEAQPQWQHALHILST
jgi:hypothetical protein